MALTTEDYIKVYCPSLFDSEDKAVYIADAQGEIGVDFWGEDYDKAVAYMASHLYANQQLHLNGVGGLITSITEGRTTQRFYNTLDGDTTSDLHNTSYGKSLLAMQRRRGLAVSISNPYVNLG